MSKNTNKGAGIIETLVVFIFIGAGIVLLKVLRTGTNQEAGDQEGPREGQEEGRPGRVSPPDLRLRQVRDRQRRPLPPRPRVGRRGRRQAEPLLLR